MKTRLWNLFVFMVLLGFLSACGSDGNNVNSGVINGQDPINNNPLQTNSDANYTSSYSKSEFENNLLNSPNAGFISESRFIQNFTYQSDYNSIVFQVEEGQFTVEEDEWWIFNTVSTDYNKTGSSERRMTNSSFDHEMASSKTALRDHILNLVRNSSHYQSFYGYGHKILMSNGDVYEFDLRYPMIANPTYFYDHSEEKIHRPIGYQIN